jgi:hypothetical protein
MQNNPKNLSRYYELVLFASLISIYAFTLYFIAPWGEFPLNDDWVYSQAALSTMKAGALRLTGYESAWSLPHIILGAVISDIFEFSHLHLRWINIFGLLLTLFATNLYLKQLNVALSHRFIALGALVFNPVGLTLSATYMTDICFVTLWVVACFAWDRWLANPRGGLWLLLGVLASTIALLDRQFGILIPLSVILIKGVEIIKSRKVSADRSIKNERLLTLTLAVVPLVIGYATHLWFRSLGGYQPPLIPGNPLNYLFIVIGPMLVFLSLSVFPLFSLALAVPLKIFKSPIFVAIALIGTICTVFCFYNNQILTGNMLSEFGFFRENEVLLGKRTIVFGTLFNSVLFFITVLGCFLAALYIAKFLKNSALTSEVCNKEDAAGIAAKPHFGVVLETATLLYLGGFILRGGFDRYLLPVIPTLLIVLCNHLPASRPPRILAAAFSLILLGTLSTFLAYDYFRWNEARWSAAQGLVATGISPSSIHAGFEWNGWHNGKVSPFPSPDITKYSHLVAFSSDFTGFTEIGSIPYRSPWFKQEQKIFILEKR